MTKDTKPSTPAEGRRQRVAAELRANLLKRRMQAKSRRTGRDQGQDSAAHPRANEADSNGKTED